MINNKTNEILDYFIEYEGYNILNSIRNADAKYDVAGEYLSNTNQIQKIIKQQLRAEIEKILNYRLTNIEYSLWGKLMDRVIEVSGDNEAAIEAVNELFGVLFKNSTDNIEKTKNDVLQLSMQDSFVILYPIYNIGNPLIPLCSFDCSISNESIVINNYSVTEELIDAIIGYDHDLEPYFGGSKQKKDFFRSLNSFKGNDIQGISNLILEEIYNKVEFAKERLVKAKQKHFEVLLSASGLGYVAPFKEEIKLVKYKTKNSNDLLIDQYLFNSLGKENTEAHINKSHYGSYPFEVEIGSGKMPKYGVNNKQWNVVNQSMCNELLAVTGPPGTGKTTVLKEIIANNIVLKTKNIIEVWDEEWEKICNDVYMSPLEGKNRYSMVFASTNKKAVDNLGLELRDEVKVFNKSSLFKVGSTFCAELGKREILNDFIEKTLAPFKDELKVIEDTPQIEESINSFNQLWEDINKANEKISEFEKCSNTIENYGYKQVHYEHGLKIKCTVEKEIDFLKDEIKEIESVLESYEKESEKYKDDISLKNIELSDNNMDKIYIERKLNDYRKKIDYPIIGFVFKALLGNKVSDLERMLSNHNNKETAIKDMLERLSEKQEFCIKAIAEKRALKSTKINALKSSELKNDDFDMYLRAFNALSTILLEDSEKINLFDQFKVCNNNYFTKRRSQLFELSLFINEAYIIKNKDFISANLTKITAPGKSVDGKDEARFFGRYYRSTFHYDCQIEKELRALWESFCMCFPVISTTLHSLERNKIHMIQDLFDVLMIDEGGQVMPHYIIGPLYRSKRAIIVGDVFQLQPVRKKLYPAIFEKHERESGLEKRYDLDICSVQSYGNEASNIYEVLDNERIGILLDEHRRCEENIAIFSNKYVYKNKMNLVKANEKDKYLNSNMIFLDIKGKKNKFNVNHTEINICHSLILKLNSQYPDSEIGIITPYKKQALELEKVINLTNVECGTVHSFQGKGKDIIVVSLVVSSLSDKRGLSFIGEEPNFLNVALTRAKSQLIIVGNLDILNYSNYLSKLKYTLIEKCKIYSMYGEKQHVSEMDKFVISEMNQIMTYNVRKDSEYNELFGEFESVSGLLSNSAHLKMLTNLFDKAKSVEVCSPWITSVVVKDDFIDRIGNFLLTDNSYKVYFGNKKTSYTLNTREDIREIVNRDYIFARTEKQKQEQTELLWKLKQMLGDNLVYKPPMHLKVLIVNSKYLVIGSHNWLCKSGTSKNSPEEISCIVDDQGMIDFVKDVLGSRLLS